jgi:PBP1b-binding outer membrane lipoprotein LpoB
MIMKKISVIFTALFLLLAGCASAQTDPAQKISPLPDATMENLTDAILSVSLAEGDAHVDET